MMLFTIVIKATRNVITIIAGDGDGKDNRYCIKRVIVVVLTMST